MFESIGWGTYAFFAAMNIVIIFPTVWFLFPETKQRSLEDVSCHAKTLSLMGSSTWCLPLRMQRVAALSRYRPRAISRRQEPWKPNRSSDVRPPLSQAATINRDAGCLDRRCLSKTQASTRSTLRKECSLKRRRDVCPPYAGLLLNYRTTWSSATASMNVYHLCLCIHFLHVACL